MSKTDDGEEKGAAAIQPPTGRGALPLNAIRVFTEAARCLSFSLAARHLGITQGGVSHHVAALEDFLGQRLFQRNGPAIALTDAGRLYFESIHEALATIELATRQLARRDGAAPQQRLVVRTSMPTLAMAVLIPVLPGFRHDPPVKVDVVTSLSPPSPTDVYDVLLTRDLHVAGAECWQVATETLVCVAAPALHAQWRGQPRWRWPFLAAKSRPDALASWMSRQPPCRDGGGSVGVAAAFDHYFLAIQAALGGMGFLVVPRLLVGQALRHGQLEEAAGGAVPSGAEYKAYVNPFTPAPGPAVAFCRWLKARLRNDGAGD